jgi:hypothetical protein
LAATGRRELDTAHAPPVYSHGMIIHPTGRMSSSGLKARVKK